MEKLQWWGYRHVNGGVQAKRFFDQRDIQDAYESDFVREVVPIFYANTREEALQIVEDRTRKTKK